jgi:hypothetical protein
VYGTVRTLRTTSYNDVYVPYNVFCVKREIGTILCTREKYYVW